MRASDPDAAIYWMARLIEAGDDPLFVALGPPLDDWSDHYLLLAHMVQHLLLIMLAAPLLLYGTPAWVLVLEDAANGEGSVWVLQPVKANMAAGTRARAVSFVMGIDFIA